jgi:hypothetical protein
LDSREILGSVLFMHQQKLKLVEVHYLKCQISIDYSVAVPMTPPPAPLYQSGVQENPLMYDAWGTEVNFPKLLRSMSCCLVFSNSQLSKLLSAFSEDNNKISYMNNCVLFNIKFDRC